MHRRTFLQLNSSVAFGAAWEENQVIREGREAALRLLQPKEKDLRHGLALHAASLVIEPYGFAPRAAIDGDAVRKAVESGASAAEIWDLTDEMENTRFTTVPSERDEFEQAWRASGVTCIFQNAGEENQDPLRVLRRLAFFTHAIDNMRHLLVKGTHPDHILAAKKENKACLVLTANAVPLKQQWATVDSELSHLRLFYQLGIRMMHLTYNRRNPIGDGCGEKSDAGLSDFGRTVIAEMNRTGIIVDVAHSGWRTSLEAAKTSTQPMVASHSACASLNNHFRAKPDEVIRAIADTGGFIGICAVPQFLGRSQDLIAMLDHIDYVAKRFGVDHVAIATDYSYRSRAAGEESRKARNVPWRPPARERFEALWPIPIQQNDPAKLATMQWTNWPLFTVGLVQRGYSDSDIQKIIGGNALRVARAVFGRAA